MGVITGQIIAPTLNRIYFYFLLVHIFSNVFIFFAKVVKTPVCIGILKYTSSSLLLLLLLLLLLFAWCVWVRACGSQRTTLWSLCSLSIFACVPGIEFRPWDKHPSLRSLPASPCIGIFQRLSNISLKDSIHTVNTSGLWDGLPDTRATLFTFLYPLSKH